MTDQVSSRFSIASKKLDSHYLSHHFAWPVTEEVKPNENIDQYIVVYDLQAGQHSRVDFHLEAVKQTLLQKETELSRLMDDCRYTLWIRYRFPSREGAFNLSPYLLSFFSLLRVEIIFHLNDI